MVCDYSTKSNNNKKHSSFYFWYKRYSTFQSMDYSNILIFFINIILNALYFLYLMMSRLCTVGFTFDFAMQWTISKTICNSNPLV